MYATNSRSRECPYWCACDGTWEVGSRGAVVEWAKERMSQGEGVGGGVYGRSRGPLLLQ